MIHVGAIVEAPAIRAIRWTLVALLVLGGCAPGPSLAPSPTTKPSPEAIGTLTFPFTERHEMEVTIVGEPGVVIGWRGTTELERRSVVFDELGDIGLGQIGERELVLGWTGTVCDVEATLFVRRDSLVVAPPPRGGCDAMAVGRGIVLTYATPVDPATIEVRLMPTTLLPEPA